MMMVMMLRIIMMKLWWRVTITFPLILCFIRSFNSWNCLTFTRSLVTCIQVKWRWAFAAVASRKIFTDVTAKSISDVTFIHICDETERWRCVSKKLVRGWDKMTTGTHDPAFSQTDLFLDWISREWDSHRRPMTNYKKLSWRHRVTEPELPLFFDLLRGRG